MATSYFWTDRDQAAERLSGAVIMFENEPVQVLEVQRGISAGSSPIAACMMLKTGKNANIALDDKGFHRFRKLPQLGWINLRSTKKPTAYFFSRIPVRQRVHGLNDSNVRVEMFLEDETFRLANTDRRLHHYMTDPGFSEAASGTYPALEDILVHLPDGCCVAYSPVFAVYRDNIGVRWLYRNRDRIGFFSGVDTLCLTEKTAFYREEIMEDKAFTLNNISEF